VREKKHCYSTKRARKKPLIHVPLLSTSEITTLQTFSIHSRRIFALAVAAIYHG